MYRSRVQFLLRGIGLGIWLASAEHALWGDKVYTGWTFVAAVVCVVLLPYAAWETVRMARDGDREERERRGD